MNEFLLAQGTQISFLLRGISLFICIVFLLPLLVKNARVKNGLWIIRILLLIYGAIGLFLNFQTMAFLFDILVNHVPQRLTNINLQFSNAAWVLIQTLIIYFIYHFQFTPESIEMHRQHEEQDKVAKKDNWRYNK